VSARGRTAPRGTWWAEKRLESEFRHAVFVDREIWEHLGSAERIREAVRLLVEVARERTA
jgi:hypothetical protein